MANRIPKDTEVIKAIPRAESVEKHGVLWCTKNKEQGNWSGLGEDGKWYYVFSSHLRNSDLYEIECFSSWEEAEKKGAAA